jgi:hypothetical protein
MIYMSIITVRALLAMALVPPQSVSSPPLELVLRCNGIQTAQQSHAVKSDAFGFGNPTTPDSDQGTKRVNRVVVIDLHGGSGRVNLPQAVLASAAHPPPEGWYPLANIVVNSDAVTAKLNLTPSGQVLRVDRRTGAAEITGYGQHTLRGTCHIDRKPQLF